MDSFLTMKSSLFKCTAIKKLALSFLFINLVLKSISQNSLLNLFISILIETSKITINVFLRKYYKTRGKLGKENLIYNDRKLFVSIYCQIIRILFAGLYIISLNNAALFFYRKNQVFHVSCITNQVNSLD